MTEECQIVDWDDGHRPGSTTVETKMVLNLNKCAHSFLQIYDKFLDDEWCDMIYNYAIEKGRPWGVYVTTEDVLNQSICTREVSRENRERAMSLEAVRAFFSQKGAYFLREDARRIHGCAVWCLASGVTNEVKYHIDYAELYRYETNTIHPPLYAGTCHVSPLEGEDMIGGDFSANTTGLAHYKIHGYKGQLSSKDAIEADMSGAGDWIKIRYKRNRGIIHDGDFPHFSSPVQSLPEGKKRVILGFNFFSEAVGECCIRAPEHSDAFNRTVKLYQMMSKLGGDSDVCPENKYGSPSGQATISTDADVKVVSNRDTTRKKVVVGGFSAKDIAKNPVMARMFVTAAKKMKAVQLREAQEEQERQRRLEEEKTAQSDQSCRNT